MILGLLLIGVFLIVFNLRAIKKEKSSFSHVLHDSEEHMEEFEFKLSELRREFSETIIELQREIEKLKGTYITDINKITDIDMGSEENSTKDNEKVDDEYSKEDSAQKEVRKTKNKTPKKENNKADRNDKNGNGVKIDEINRMLSEGSSIDEISEKLGVGKGEVLLIKELYLR